ncbi:MAG: acetyl-CoA C-acetyltransferase [Phycisphaerae bacterium]|nr:acetyl-CoA C-acetyltransferase [Phycisphaerae bacterium]
MLQSVIVGAKRSPIGRFLGSLSTLPAPKIGSAVAKGLLDSVGCPAADVDWAMVGQVLQAGIGQNPARQVALGAGCSGSITAVTVNQVCGSGLRSVMDADNNIRLGQAKVVLAGGIENMSDAPYLVRELRFKGTKFGDAKLVDAMQYDGLTDVYEGTAMGVIADYTAEKHNVTREDQDKFALESHQRAGKAQADGAFKEEIVHIEVPAGRKKTVVFEADETIRAENTLEGLAALRPAFGKDGTVTAGNASQISDGAAMVLVTSEEEAARRNWKVRARIVSHATFGLPPKELFLTPVGAVKLAVERAGLKLSDIDLFELNEAFAAQSVACLRGLELDNDRVNVFGGGIALGHPIGASGARVLVTLIHAMERRNVKRGVASLCLGGGNAVAMVIER